MTHTIAIPNENEFEFLASIIAMWDESETGIIRKRSALDKLLTRSEIDGYKKTRVNGNKDCLIWAKKCSDLTVFITRVKDGLYDVEVMAGNLMAKAMNIPEL